MNERTELHCHTKMSEMIGLSDVKELIRKAREMGMPAIAITDNDTVQAFPEAFREWWNTLCEDDEDDGIKVLFGIETSLVDDQNAVVMNDIGQSLDTDYVMTRRMTGHKIIIIPTSLKGMKILYELISEVSFNSSDSSLKIPKSLLAEKREELFIGSCAQNGDVSRAVFENQADESIRKLVGFYDFVEVEPVDNYIYVLGQSPGKENLTQEEVKENIKRIVQIGDEESVPVIASANVYYVNKADVDAFKVLRYARGFKDSKGWKAKHHLMSAKELLTEFYFMGEEAAKAVVIDNPNRIAAELAVVQPVSPKKQYPIYPNANLILENLCYEKAHELYGDKLPNEVKKRLEFELSGIKKNEYASLYMIAYELVKKSNEAGYLVGSRAGCGASVVSYLVGISEANPLPAHYICRNCGYTDFEVSNIRGFYPGDAGADLPDRKCPICGEKLSKDGYDIPVETFLGFYLDKEPDFDLNFAGEYQREAQRSLTEIEGVGKICRAGTVGTLSERLARAYANKYFKDRRSGRKKESIKKVADKLVGVKKLDGLHPSGIVVVPDGIDVSAYTPLLPGEFDEIPSTQIEYHPALDGALLKMDVIGHNSPSFLKHLFEKTGVDPRDICIDDKRVMSLFSSTEVLGLDPEKISGVTVGTLGDPEYGYAKTRSLLELIRPKRFSDILKVSNMMHGTNSWDGNAEEIVKEGVARFSDCIASRDDIMLYLTSKGLNREDAFKIMEYVCKGWRKYGLKEEWIAAMRKADVPEWYIQSCEKIWYLFPKAHGVHYALTSWRLLYYKLYYPEAFYDGWLKYWAKVDRNFVEKGYDYAKEKYEELWKKDKRKMGYRMKDLMDDLLVVMEMYARGVHLE